MDEEQNPWSLEFLHTGVGYLQFDPDIGYPAFGVTDSWVRLEVVDSTMPNGTLLVYTTFFDEMIENVEDTYSQQIGWVESDREGDAASLLFAGGQSITLGIPSIDLTPHQLHFAVKTGDGAIEAFPNVHTTSAGLGALWVTVNGTFGEMNLLATIDERLSPDTRLAWLQRLENLPYVELAESQTLHVEVKGSAGNWNTLHFVRIGYDDAVGGWAVGGEAYANTDAFRAAVQANWDPASEVSGGRGDFEQSFEWTVSTGSGRYAPVLSTEDGDIFTIDAAPYLEGGVNVDGRDHIRIFGENTFGFEDLRADQGSDWDYNDMVVRLQVASEFVIV